MKKSFLALAPWSKIQELSIVVSYGVAGSICQVNLNLGLSYLVGILFYKLQNLYRKNLQNTSRSFCRYFSLLVLDFFSGFLPKSRKFNVLLSKNQHCLHVQISNNNYKKITSLQSRESHVSYITRLTMNDACKPLKITKNPEHVSINGGIHYNMEIKLK